MMRFKLNQSRYSERGGIALYLVMIVSILLMTTTVVASRLAVSELSQASEVDQSDGAYYAAEAGVEEASRRLDANTNEELTLAEIFPEQFVNGANGGSQHGDRMELIDDNGSQNLGGSLGIQADPASDHADYFGRLSWRQRRVYEEPLAPLGTQVKDESIQLDTTDLRREVNGIIYGEDGLDSDGSVIHNAFGGVEYCWTPKAPSGPISPELELTVLSYPSGNAGAIETEKYIFSANSNATSGRHISISAAGVNPTEQDLYANCVDITTNNPNRRYIFRIRPLFGGVGGANPNAYQVSYRTKLIDNRLSSHQPGSSQPPLYIPGSTVLIDVVGQSGDIRRRIVARKERTGRILGIFDYVLYSGDPVLPLCKAGVQQSDEPNIPGAGYTLGNCILGSNINQGQEQELPELPQDDPPAYAAPPPPPTTFNYTGGVQTYVVPSGVTQIQIEALGAQGGDGYVSDSTNTGGRGARASGILSVTPGETLYIYVGGAGAASRNAAQSPGGWNGGGNGGQDPTQPPSSGGGGGGGSDVRRGGTGLNNRVIVAGGGGGGGGGFSAPTSRYGAAAGLNGATAPDYNGGMGGGGGTQSAGGIARGRGAVSGSFGVGGRGNTGLNAYGGGGGGGGWYGGAGGGANNDHGAGWSGGGGGGSSYIGGVGSGSVAGNHNTGNGRIVLTPL